MVDEARDTRRWAILASVGVGTIMGTLDSSVVNIAMPTITKAFNTTIEASQWIAISYLLVISSLLLVYGRLGDVIGHKRVYLAGFGIFTLSSALCGFSASIQMLIGLRVLQAIGAGMLMATGPAIITAAFPAQERGVAMGLNSTMVAIGLSVGPFLGGVLVHAFGWPSIFFINVPIGIAGLVWATRVLPAAKTTAHRWSHRGFDLPGAFAVALFLVLLLFALSRGNEWGWGSVRTLGLLSISTIIGLIFIRIELKAADPLMDLTLFRNRAFSSASLTALLNFMAQFSIVFLAPFFLQEVLMLPPDRAGALLVISPIVMMVIAPIAGTVSDRYGSRTLTSVGMLIVAGSLFSMSRLGADAGIGDVAWRVALMGLGTGIFQSPNNSTIMGSVPKHRLGLASGMLATVRNTGMALGIAVSSAIYLSGMSRGQTYVDSLSQAFLVGAFIALAGVLAALSARSTPNASTRDGLKAPSGGV